MDKESAVERVVAGVGDLPAMPAVVARVLEITEDPSSQMSDLSDCVHADPALTAKILRVSNSSYYGMKQYVGTLKLALVILGVREIRNIVLGISVFETLRQNGADANMASEIWAHSLRVAGIAKKLAAHMGLGFQGEEFISGLLHDIGKMVLLCQLREEYGKLYKKLKDDQQGLYEAELDELGFTNADAAMALASKWNLPQTLADALWYQYADPDRPLTDAKDPKLAAITRIAKRAGRDDFTVKDDAEIAALQDSEAWSCLTDVKKPIPAGERRQVLAGFVGEVDEAPSVPL
ncbi:MAG: HDOD domain-containing protein [Candidatus Hydrogenedentota bacterium]